MTIRTNWWESASVYQVYVRSFADGNGDGNGDLAGVRSRLGYIADLGFDAIWFNPWYQSPMADGGYDVADYREINPMFGTLAEAELLIAEAHALGLRVIADVVPNHGSVEQAWFRAALAGSPGSLERQRFHFRAGRGSSEESPPNNWQSLFGGGSAWTRTVGPDGTPGEWYLSLFTPEQPDLNWANPEVQAEFESVLRFWFDRGIDGFRVDVAMMLAKDPALADVRDTNGSPAAEEHPFFDRDGVHDIYRSWRQIADSYADRRFLVGEVWVADHDRLLRYLRHDELDSAFNFDLLRCPLEAPALHQVIDVTVNSLLDHGAVPSWVLGNHDVVREVTRYGRQPPGPDAVPLPEVTDLVLGTRRARAAALLAMSLPGALFVYQGEELGLPEVEDLPEAALQDPIWDRSGHQIRGRDGCRVPLPWSGRRPPFGFSPCGTEPWLPQPAAWLDLTVDAQSVDPDSTLTLYRRALRYRCTEPSLQESEFSWMIAPAGVLAFSRGADLVVVVNLSPVAIDMPPNCEMLLSSGPCPGERIPPDVTAWFRSLEPGWARTS